jgi:hypothetical protein
MKNCISYRVCWQEKPARKYRSFVGQRSITDSKRPPRPTSCTIGPAILYWPESTISWVAVASLHDRSLLVLIIIVTRVRISRNAHMLRSLPSVLNKLQPQLLQKSQTIRHAEHVHAGPVSRLWGSRSTWFFRTLISHTETVAIGTSTVPTQF